MSRFEQEIRDQPAAIRRTITSFQRNNAKNDIVASINAADLIVFTGMGSSFAAAYYGACLFSERGKRAVAIDASELLYYQRSLLCSNTLLIVISQSGQSVEIGKLLDMVQSDISVFGITNSLHSPLALKSTYPLHLDAGEEYAASTKTFTCTLAMLYLISQHLRGGDGGAVLTDAALTIERQISVWNSQAVVAAGYWHSNKAAVAVGRGAAYSTALAASLLLQEVAKLPCHAMTGGHFQHGPLEAISPQLGYLILESSSQTCPFDVGLVGTLGRTKSLVQNRIVYVGSQTLDSGLTFDVQTQNEEIRPLFTIVPIQLLALELAALRHIDPDEYRFGQKVILSE